MKIITTEPHKKCPQCRHFFFWHDRIGKKWDPEHRTIRFVCTKCDCRLSHARLRDMNLEQYKKYLTPFQRRLIE